MPAEDQRKEMHTGGALVTCVVQEATYVPEMSPDVQPTGIDVWHTLETPNGGTILQATDTNCAPRPRPHGIVMPFRVYSPR